MDSEQFEKQGARSEALHEQLCELGIGMMDSWSINKKNESVDSNDEYIAYDIRYVSSINTRHVASVRGKRGDRIFLLSDRSIYRGPFWYGCTREEAALKAIESMATESMKKKTLSLNAQCVNFIKEIFKILEDAMKSTENDRFWVNRDSSELSLQKILIFLRQNDWNISAKPHNEDKVYFISKNGKGFILPPEEYIDFESRSLEALYEIAKVESRRPSEIFDYIAQIQF